MKILKNFFEIGFNKLSPASKNVLEQMFLKTDDYCVKCSKAAMFFIKENIYSVMDVQNALLGYKERNKYAYVASMPPRRFGEDECQEIVLSHLKNGVMNNPESAYDIIYNNNVKCEVKGCRASSFDKKNDRTPLSERMFMRGEVAKEKFNFQQIKVDEADIFVFLVVYLDDIDCYVFDKNTLRPMVNRQHRGGNGSEGQVVIYSDKHSQYRCGLNDLENKINELTAYNEV